jgi:hypothetical protein
MLYLLVLKEIAPASNCQMNNLKEFIILDARCCISLCKHFLTDDAFREGGGSELLEPPPVEMSTLPLIAKVCSNQNERFIYFICSHSHLDVFSVLKFRGVMCCVVLT